MSEEQCLESADLEEMLRLLDGKLLGRKIRILMWLYVGWILTATGEPASNKLADDLEEYAEGTITGRVLARRFMKSKSKDLAAFGHPWSFDGSREPSIREVECGALWILLMFLPIGTVTLGDSRVWQAAREAESTDKVRIVMREMIAVLHDVAGNPFRPVSFDPAWRTSTVVALAQQMYDSRDFSAMPILGDALQDAGCGHPDILEHCRSAGPHVRGCWVVDLALGKE